MSTISELLKKGETQTIWNKYCGFANLDWEEFNYIQERLLLEQMEMMSGCLLGKKIMGSRPPKTVKDFRKFVPITTYEDYAEYLLEKREDVLPTKPEHWICTTWKGGQSPEKWAPYSELMIRENVKALLASLILATSDNGRIGLKERDKFFYGMAPLPYLTGLAPYGIASEIDFEYLPGLTEAEKMTFRERNKKGFSLGLEKGIDIFFGLSSVLVKIAESFSEQLRSGSGGEGSPGLKTVARVGKGLLKSKISGRELLPRDVWNVKGIVCAGTDTSFYKDRIEYYWGKRPLEIYGGTELSMVATEAHGTEGMLFFPDVNYLEFIPEEESVKIQSNPGYQPETMLLNELEVGERYEIVTTKLKGGAFVRYRVGDLIRVVAPPQPQKGIHLPQIRYEDRVSNVVDLAGFTRITEPTINEALLKTGHRFNNWAARKEAGSEGPYLHLYLEPARDIKADSIEAEVYERLSEVDSDFRDCEEMLGMKPLKVTILSPGTFKECAAKYGGLEHSRFNPSDEYIGKMTEVSAKTPIRRKVG